MAQQYVLSAFMYAYCMLSPQAAEMIELRAEEVALHRILALYPLDVRDITGWLLKAVGDERSAIIKFSKEIVATTSVTSIHGSAKFEKRPASLNHEHRAAFYEDGYEELMVLETGQRWTSTADEPSKPYPSWAQRFVAELLWIGTHWNELVELHEWEQAYVDDLLLLARLVGAAKARERKLIELTS